MLESKLKGNGQKRSKSNKTMTKENQEKEIINK